MTFWPFSQILLQRHTCTIEQVLEQTEGRTTEVDQKSLNMFCFCF